LAKPPAIRRLQPNRPHVEVCNGVVVIGGSIEPSDVAALCERASRTLASRGDVCHIATVPTDLTAVDVAARMTLAARRLDRGIRLRLLDPALRELLVLSGLADVVSCEPESGVDPGR
jgi:hypothetical protein